MLTAQEVERFIGDGFVYLPGAFPRQAMAAAGKLDSPARELVLATGRPGDVYLCHPFLIHAAQPHRGRQPRFIAQPPLIPVAPRELHRDDGAYSPVELAVLSGLGSNA